MRPDFKKNEGRPGQTYEHVEKLGEGAFGVAHLVRDRRNYQLYVLKTINKRQSQVPPAQMETEIRNLKACDHPHIIRLFEYYEDYENIYLIMERAAGGELNQVLQEQKKKKHADPRAMGVYSDATKLAGHLLCAFHGDHSQGPEV